jgi:signal transduction histidine kinase
MGSPIMPLPRVSLPRSLTSLIVAAAGVLLVLSSVTLWAAMAYESRLQAVRHSIDVQRSLASVLSILQDAETGQRGYLLTGSPAYLKPYDRAVKTLPVELDHLSALVIDNERQHAEAQALRPLVEAKFEELNQTIILRRTGRVEEAQALVRTDLGRKTMDELRAKVADMGALEAALLEARSRDSRLYSYGMFGLLAVLMLSVLAVLTLGLLQARQTMAALERSTRDALAANRRLEEEVAERNRAEDRVRQMQKIEAVGQLTGGIAHDFNNMLAIIIGNLELAGRRIDERPRLEKALEHALDAAARAAALTKRLLAFSRQQPLEPQTLDLNKTVSGMSDLLLRTLGETVRVETVLAGGLWKTFVDPGEVENAIVNLAVNARDAMPDGGRLTIETANTHLDDLYAQQNPDAKAGQYVMVCVSDTGAGMPPEVIAQAFDPFFTTKPVGKGTGLGLSQIHGFIKQSGGHVRIYSEDGKGTTIKLYLPRRYGEDMPAAPAQAPLVETLVEGSPEQVILVVEDEENVRLISVETLRALGYSVRHAQDGPSALAMLDELGAVSLLFTDVVMPGMTGRQLADAAQVRQPDLKVLYTTGYTRNAVVHNGVVDPGMAFLPKPFTVNQLAAKVSSVLQG